MSASLRPMVALRPKISVGDVFLLPYARREAAATNAARRRAARATSRTSSTTTEDKVRKQCTTAGKLTELNIDCPGSHVTKRYRPALAGSDGIFADHSRSVHPTIQVKLSRLEFSRAI
jgi:hypothetical protein